MSRFSLAILVLGLGWLPASAMTRTTTLCELDSEADETFQIAFKAGEGAGKEGREGGGERGEGGEGGERGESGERANHCERE